MGEWTLVRRGVVEPLGMVEPLGVAEPLGVVELLGCGQTSGVWSILWGVVKSLGCGQTNLWVLSNLWGGGQTSWHGRLSPQ